MKKKNLCENCQSCLTIFNYFFLPRLHEVQSAIVVTVTYISWLSDFDSPYSLYISYICSNQHTPSFFLSARHLSILSPVLLVGGLILPLQMSFIEHYTWIGNTLRFHHQHLSRVMRKPTFCICKNKDAHQLRGNREADQRLCFPYINSTIPLICKRKLQAWFVLNQVGNQNVGFLMTWLI